MEIIDKENKLHPDEQDNLVATLLSYVVYKIYCGSAEHQIYWRNANRSREYAKKKLGLVEKDVEVRRFNASSFTKDLFSNWSTSWKIIFQYQSLDMLKIVFDNVSLHCPLNLQHDKLHIV